MKKTTLHKREHRLDQLEQEVARVQQHLGMAPLPGESVAPPAELDSSLDRFFGEAGIGGGLSGLAQLRALQAEQERFWANGSPKRNAAADPRARRKRGRGQGR